MSLADAGKESSLTKRDESMTIGGAHLKVDYARGQLPIMHTLIVTAQVAADNAFWQQQGGLHVDVSPAVKSSPLRL
jgi:hypothetical protein